MQNRRTVHPFMRAGAHVQQAGPAEAGKQLHGHIAAPASKMRKDVRIQASVGPTSHALRPQTWSSNTHRRLRRGNRGGHASRVRLSERASLVPGSGIAREAMQCASLRGEASWHCAPMPRISAPTTQPLRVGCKGQLQSILRKEAPVALPAGRLPLQLGRLTDPTTDRLSRGM